MVLYYNLEEIEGPKNTKRGFGVPAELHGLTPLGDTRNSQELSVFCQMPKERLRVTCGLAKEEGAVSHHPDSRGQLFRASQRVACVWLLFCLVVFLVLLCLVLQVPGGVLTIPPRVLDLDDRQCFTARSARRKKNPSINLPNSSNAFSNLLRSDTSEEPFSLLKSELEAELSVLDSVELFCSALALPAAIPASCARKTGPETL